MAYIFVVLIAELILLITVIILTAFDYTCPSFITLIMFILSTISYIYNFENWNVELNGMTVVIMISGLFTVVFVEALVRDNYLKRYNNKENHGFLRVESEEPWVKDRIMKWLIFISSILMMLIYVREVRTIGHSLNLANMISSIGAVKNSEYHTSALATICLRIGYAMANLYAFIFCHNVILSHESFIKNVYLLISAVAGVVSSFFSGSRSLMFGTIFSFIFYYIIFNRVKKGWKEVKIGKYLKYIIPVMVLFLAIFYVSRSIVKNREYNTSAIDYITYYLGNSQQLLNLSTFYDNVFNIESKYPGLYTFQFLYNELSGFGLVSLPTRVSSPFLNLDTGVLTRGNVYTLFGEPYHDFGLIGMLVYVALFYFIVSHYYYKYIRYWNNRPKSKKVLLLFGTQYYFVLFTFYLAPTIWIKIQTIVTMVIVLIAYKVLTKWRFKISKYSL